MIAHCLFFTAPDRLQPLAKVETMQPTMRAEQATAGHYWGGRVWRQVPKRSLRLGNDPAGLIKTIKPCAVVLGGYNDATVDSNRGRHIKVSFRGRHELPKALSGFHVPAAERMLVVTHDLPPAAKFAADKRRIGCGQPRRGPAFL